MLQNFEYSTSKVDLSLGATLPVVCDGSKDFGIDSILQSRVGTGFKSQLNVVRNPFFKNLSSKCLAQIPEFFVSSHDFLDTNFTGLAFKSSLLSGKPNTGSFSGILSSLFSLFLYPVLQYTTEQVLTFFVKLHFYLKIEIKAEADLGLLQYSRWSSL